MLKIIILFFIISFSVFGIELQKNGDRVIDIDNNLIWQDHKDNVKLRVTHNQAIQYCKLLEQNDFINWRLPSIEEYKRIINNSRRKKENIMIDKVFHHIIEGDYWTNDRTWIRNFGRYAYFVFVKSGHIYYQNRDYYKNVRCIRDNK